MKSLNEFKFSDIRAEVVVKSLIVCIVDTIKYFYCLYAFIISKKSYSKVDIFDDDIRAKVQLFSLALIFKLYNEPHYRSPSFQIDLIDNLKNVAVPGTGLPLSLFCYNWYITLLFIVFLNPTLCFMGAIHKAWRHSDNSNTFILKIFEYYSIHLLQPDDWFSLWRINCALVSYHSLILAKKNLKESHTITSTTTKTTAASSSPSITTGTSVPTGHKNIHECFQETGYKQENKWAFLVDGKKLGVPVSPYITNVESIVCKNINVEGGMGIHFFKVSNIKSKLLLLSLNIFSNLLFVLFFSVISFL